MKSLSGKLGVVLFIIGLAIFGDIEVWGADWEEFAETTTGIFYYDVESVTSPSKGFYRVWIHNTTKHESSLIEIDCKEKNYRVLDVIEYDETNRFKVKARYDYYDNTRWLVISQGTVPEPLHSILCP